MQPTISWTATDVADALVQVYGLLEGAPVLSRGDGFAVDGKRVGARSLAAWVGMRRYVADERDLKILRIWASCTARGESVAARFRDLYGQTKTPDRRRCAALKAIAAGLNAERAMAALGMP